MAWGIVVEILLQHDYYAPSMPPLLAKPSDVTTFARAGFLLRQSGARILVLAEDEETDLPATLSLDLEVQNTDVVMVSEGADWLHVPHIVIGADSAEASLADAVLTETPQVPGHTLLARVTVDLTPQTKREVTLRFAARTSHWAYHVIGPDNDDVLIEDSEGAIAFDRLGRIDLPDGTPAQVIRSRDALPARARPPQRFTLSRPGPFGPRTLIPILPAPQPLFATVPTPDGTGALVQSDIYVSIF